MSNLILLEAQSSDPQVASRLFKSPIEIRRNIYLNLINSAGFHVVRTEEGIFRLSGCVGPDIYAEDVGRERRPTPDCDSKDPTWGRRLNSTWGPHWKCEEIHGERGEREERDLALKGTGEVNGHSDSQSQASWRDNSAILRVCKRMHMEVAAVLAEQVFFHVTDLCTLGALLQSLCPCPSDVYTPQSFIFKDSLLPYITKLQITLRLSLPLFEALDTSCAKEEDSSSPDFKDDIDTWSTLAYRLTQLKKLRTCRIWLDHTNKAYWSMVNERGILSQFESLADNCHLDLGFDLPKLHPKLEDPQRHYLSKEVIIDRSFPSTSPFEINRVLRQRYQYIEIFKGVYYATYVPDFPHCLDHQYWRTHPLSDRETYERGLWLKGGDVLTHLRETEYYRVATPQEVEAFNNRRFRFC